MNPRFKYRGDIDGLRAVAVLLVVLFHLDLTAFSGGYIGVDVFFVISGYLISAIIEKKLQTDSFSFKDFYIRRVKRLFPALFATILATVLGSLLILGPTDLQAMGKSAAAAVVSLSNFVFYFESGYWDADSSFKPLLHTWSLGVEEQFYLFWPSLFLLLFTIRKRVSILVTTFLITLVGGIACYLMSGVDKSAAFYLFPFRIFQFSIGAFTLHLSRTETVKRLFRKTATKDISILIGLMGIIGFSFLVTEKTVFPGFAIYPPTLAACLVLIAFTNSEASLFSGFLTNRFSAWVGRISYSMYLIHWPIIVLYRYSTNPDLTWIEQCGLGAVIMLGTLVLHYGVERAFYQRAIPNEQQGLGGQLERDRGVVLRTVGVMATLAGVSVFIWLSRPLSATMSGNGRLITAEQVKAARSDGQFFWLTGCPLSRYFSHYTCERPSELNMLVIGDSHEGDGFNFLISGYAQSESLKLIKFGNIKSCVEFDFVNERVFSEKCQTRLDNLFDPRFLDNLDFIFYSSKNPYNHLGGEAYKIFDAMLVKNPDIKLIVLGDYIETNVPCSRLINESGTSNSCKLPKNVIGFGNEGPNLAYIDVFKAMTDHYIDRANFLCADGKLENCMVETNDGIPMMYDQDHLLPPFAMKTGYMYWQKNKYLLREMMKQPSKRQRQLDSSGTE